MLQLCVIVNCYRVQTWDHGNTCISSRSVTTAAAINASTSFAAPSVCWLEEDHPSRRPWLDHEVGLPARPSRTGDEDTAAFVASSVTTSADVLTASKICRLFLCLQVHLLGDISHVPHAAVMSTVRVQRPSSDELQQGIQAQCQTDNGHWQLLQHGVRILGVHKVQETLHLLEWRHPTPDGHSSSAIVPSYLDIQVSISTCLVLSFVL